MSVGRERVLPEPEPEPVDFPVQSHRHSIAWRWVAVAAALLAVIGMVVWSIRHSPLGYAGNSGQGFGPTSSAYGFAIENTGPFEVEVTGIELPSIPGYLWSPKVEVAEPGAYVGDVGEPRRPFQPFTLSQGAERAIILSGKTSCVGTRRGQSMTIHGITVQYKVLGIPRTRTISLWSGYQVNPPARVCDPPPPPAPARLGLPDTTNARL